MSRTRPLWGVGLFREWLGRAVTTDRIIVLLSLIALYGKQLLDAISVGPASEIAAVLGPSLRGVGVFYWASVWMMYFIHLLAVRTVFGGTDLELLDRYPSFAHVFAAIATSVGQYFLVTSLPSKTAPAYLRTAVTTHGIAVLAPFIGLLVFAKLCTREPLTQPDSSYLSILTQAGVDPDDLVALHAADDVRRFAPYFVVLAVTSLYFVPLALMGSFTALFRIYPGVLEVLAIVSVVAAKSLRASTRQQQRVDLAEQFDQAGAFDSPFYDVISNTPVGAGWGLIMALLFGTLLIPLPVFQLPAVGPAPIDTFVAGLRGLVLEGPVPRGQAIGLLTRAVFWFVLTSTPYLVLLFGLWFWYQTARRTPSIIQRRARRSEAHEYDGEVDSPPVARPRGWLLPVVGLLLVTYSHPVYQIKPGLAIPALRSPAVQIAAWTASLGLFGWCMVATITSEPRLPRFPTVELLLPGILTAAALVFGARQWSLLPAYVAIFGVILFLMHFERLLDWIQAPSRRSRGLRILPVAGVFVLVLSWVQSTVTAVGYGVAIGVLLLFVGEWRARERAEDSD